jgi:hypothetical protein
MGKNELRIYLENTLTGLRLGYGCMPLNSKTICVFTNRLLIIIHTWKLHMSGNSSFKERAGTVGVKLAKKN